MNNSFYILLFLFSVVIASLSQVLLKKSATKSHANMVKEYLNPYVIFGYGMMFVSTLLTIFAYKGLAYKNGPIIETVGYVLVMIFGLLFFREKITKKKLAGSMFIILGIVVFYI